MSVAVIHNDSIRRRHMEHRFDEMPLIIGGHRVGMFDGRATIRTDGKYPVVEDFVVLDSQGRHIRFADHSICQLFHTAILAYFAVQIDEEIDERSRANPEHRYYGRLLETEMR
jgi:hypothetical protein